PEMLSRSDLAANDRKFVTELVYGTTRMRRACDHLVDRFLLSDPDPQVRAALRLGAYQLTFLGTPAHAAVGATVGAVKGRGRSVVNAVLRKVADAPVVYPDAATELSYPDWMVELLRADLGPDRAIEALTAMNASRGPATRADGYVQDIASQLVVDATVNAVADATVEVAGSGRPSSAPTIVDLCAAPGGKATGVASALPGATVVAADLRQKRVRLIRENRDRLDVRLPLVVADGAKPPFAPGSVDAVLVDAPCSGLGSLRGRADARWRIDRDAPERLARLQVELVLAGLELLSPGGVLVYSVCTLTAAEGRGVLESVLTATSAATSGKDELPAVDVIDGPPDPWQTVDGVSTLLPSADGAPDSDPVDGMLLFRLRRRGAKSSTA
ncbi:MAG: transcription antitermination factor NusB, partial [Acidimicrobiales bacterium]